MSRKRTPARVRRGWRAATANADLDTSQDPPHGPRRRDASSAGTRLVPGTPPTAPIRVSTTDAARRRGGAQQRVCIIAGNHDEARPRDGSRLASSVSPSNFSDSLNANLAHEWIVRTGKLTLPAGLRGLRVLPQIYRLYPPADPSTTSFPRPDRGRARQRRQRGCGRGDGRTCPTCDARLVQVAPRAAAPQALLVAPPARPRSRRA